jgi:metal-dependent hydrolase (beta-lactamase superfamily II)
MKLTILSENQMSPSKSGYKTCSAEWGLSLFIELDNANILFDTGHSEPSIKTMLAMNSGLI